MAARATVALVPSVAVALTVATALAVAALLVAEAREHRVAKAISKTLAAAGFVAVALTRGALDARWSTALAVGLGLSVVGDLCLLSHARRHFLAGLFAFLCGHVAYVAAFALRGLSPSAVAAAAPLVIAGLVVVGRWLLPHVDDKMRGPVVAYMLVISAMVAAAVGTYVHARSLVLAAGALAFYVSDLSVARDRFVAPGLVNRVWGLPAYFGGQLLLAWSV